MCVRVATSTVRALPATTLPAASLMSQLPRLPCRLLERAAGHGSIHGAGVGVQNYGSAAGRQQAEGRAPGQGPCASGDQCYAGPGAPLRDRPAGVLCAGPESLPGDGAVTRCDMGRERGILCWCPSLACGHIVLPCCDLIAQQSAINTLSQGAAAGARSSVLPQRSERAYVASPASLSLTHQRSPLGGAARCCAPHSLPPGGEMLDAVNDKGHYSEDEARTAFLRVLQGVQYLHSR